LLKIKLFDEAAVEQPENHYHGVLKKLGWMRDE
jgi:hypothetical protein